MLSAVVALIAAGASSLAAPVAATASEGTVYSPEAPVVDMVEGGPWNTSQGDPSAGSAYLTADLSPTFLPGGAETTLGGVHEPNVAVYPGTGSVPYASGVAGTPGPLDGYCSSLGANPETGSPVSQPTGTQLPFSPYYFPDIVRDADGSLTGYFDYRPKDAEEAITVARSTDNGKTWITEGKALGENSGYCPTADTNDDGQGHPYVAAIGGSTKLYTLQRPAGDYEGVGLLVHNVEPSATNPLEKLPANEPVGIDPNTYATAQTNLSTTATNIPVTTLGGSQGPNTIVAGPYVDYTQNSPTSGSAPTVITCTGTTTSPSDELTGCTIPSGSFTVGSNDDLVQVMEKAKEASTVPAGPNVPDGEGGLSKLKWTVNAYGYANATSNSNALAWLMNNNAPNRVYIDGHAVYCNTTNTNPITTNLQFCTSPTGSFSVSANDAITGDPITPPTAQMTTGLVSPDGIVGTVPYTANFNGHSVPSNATITLYTEKIVNYFLEGELNGSLNSAGTTYTKGNFTLPGGTTTFGLNYQPYPGTSEPLPASGSFKIYTVQTVGSTNSFATITCTGWNTTPASNAPPNSVNVTGCTSSGTGKLPGTESTNSAVGAGQGDWIGGPNAATVPFSVLNQIGEGANGSKSAFRLLGDNEDYTVLRAAYTTNGINFTDLGPVSGTSSGTGSTNGSYTDLANPLQQNSPENSAHPTVGTTSPTAPTNMSPGSADTIELRYIGSRGTIITNPDGSLGMFLSGAWPTDGDSDAFNQIFYASSTNGGQTWSVPTVVMSTDYTFKASREQDRALEEGKDEPLGISAYYSGRAYGPAIVQNLDGSLTMVFSGYRLPKPVTKAGTELGTNTLAPYTIGAKDPAIYRNILTLHLTSATSPAVQTTTSVASSDEGAGLVGAPVAYTATVAPVAPGAGTPTGTVSFSDSNGPISGCGAQPLSKTSPDTATCATSHESPAGSDELTATYSGDANYAGSSGSEQLEISEPPAITSAEEATFTEGKQESFTVTATGTPRPAITETGTLPNGVHFNNGVLSGTPTQHGTFHISFAAANGVGTEATQSFTLTVGVEYPTPGAPHVTVGSNPNATGLFTLGWTGTNPLSGFGITYTLQHKNASAGSQWVTAAAGLSSLEYAFTGTGEEEGTWTYRVQGHDASLGETTAWSEASPPVKVDESAPYAPTAVASRAPDYAGDDGWYTGGVEVDFAPNGEPNLSDGSPGSGVDLLTLSSPQTYGETGVYKACGTVEDNVGNESAPGCLTVQVDDTPPSLEIVCPASAPVGEAGVEAVFTASDQYSGLASEPIGSAPIDTSTLGETTVSTTAISNVGLETTRSCATKIVKKAEAISFANPGTQTYLGPDFDAGATASSGLAVTYTATGVCSITEAGLVHLAGAGSCSVTAHQGGGTLYSAAEDVERTFSVEPASQSIGFSNPGTQTYGEAPFTPTATASSELAVSFQASGNCRVEGGKVAITGAGSCTVTAEQSGDGDFRAAAPVSQSFAVEKAEQSIEFSVAEHTYGDPDFTISATATSGESVSFTHAAGECTVSGETVHITGAGSCTIDANQPGNADYKAAQQVQDTFDVKQASQSITFPAISDKTYGEADFAPGATTSSGLGVSYSAIGDCTMETGEVHITAAGACTVKASQGGNENYAPASAVERTFTIGKASQSISFNQPAASSYGAAPFKVSATASSGLAVSFSGTGACTVSPAGVVTITAAGACYVTASQAGNGDYQAATSVTRTISVAAMETKVALKPLVKNTKDERTIKFTATVTAAAAGYKPTSGTVSFYVNNVLHDTQALNGNGVEVYIYYVTLPVSRTPYDVTAVFTSGDPNYSTSTSEIAKFKVKAA